MATTTTKSQFYKSWSWPGNNQVSTAFYQTDDEANLAVINDIIKVAKLPANCMVVGAALRLGRFDSHGSPTATFSVRITDGSDDWEIIKDATIGRLASGDMAHPGERAADELLGLFNELDGDYWVEIELTAAHATATSSARNVGLVIYYIASS